MASVIDTLFLEFGLQGDFVSQAEKALEKTNQLEQKVQSFGQQVAKAGKDQEQFGEGLRLLANESNKFKQAVSSIAVSLASGLGLDQVFNETKQYSTEVNNLAKNLGMSSKSVSEWQEAVKALGGSVSGVTNLLKKLSAEAVQVENFGDSKMNNLFKGLGVDLVDATGKARDLNAIMLDLADAFSKMDRVKGFQLAQEMGIDEGTFNLLVQGRKKVEKSLEKSTKAEKKQKKALEETEKQQKKNIKTAKNFAEAIGQATRFATALGATLLSGMGLTNLSLNTAKANLELDNMSKNLGMSSQSLSAWQGVAETTGGSAEGMTSYLNSLSSSLSRLTLMGDTSGVQFFEALGVAMLDGSGKARNLDDIMLDLSDSLSQMDRGTAFNIAKQMGMDEGTFNMLVQGRKVLQEGLQKQHQIYRSNAQDLETSRKLTEATRYLNQQFEGLKLMIANAALPILLKVSEVASNFFGFLQQNENLVKAVFFGISAAITTVMIPSLLKGAAAGLRFILPFMPMIIIVGLLAAAFALLYDDYQTWANGGNSLFNWGKFINWLDKANFSAGSLLEGIVQLLTGYSNLNDVLKDGRAWAENMGFFENGKVTMSSFIEGITNVGKAIWDYIITGFKKVGELMDAVMEGDWKKVLSIGWDLFTGYTPKGFILGKIVDNVTDTENVAKAVDKMGQVDPNDPDSLTSQQKQGNLYDAEKGFSKDNENPVEKSKSIPSYQGSASVKGLNQAQTANLLKQVISKESGGKQDAENSFGYLGLYQFGAAALADAGLIDMAKYKKAVNKYGKAISNGSNAEIHKAFLADESNWTIKGGRSTYLSSRSLQDESMIRLMNKNAGYLGNVYQGSAEHKGGLLMASHLKGASNAKKYALTGQDMVDGYGTRISSYYKKGKEAVALASKSSPNPLFDPNRPMAGYGIVEQRSQVGLSSMQANAQPQNINNNQKTEVVVNGGIVVNSSSPTIEGNTNDAMVALYNRATAMHFNNGLR